MEGEVIMKLQNKIALVTGSSSGIGKGIAVGFAKEGADVVVNYHSRKNLAEETVNIVKKLGRRAIAIQADVAKIDDVTGLIDGAWAMLGKIDILVNNAGISPEVPFLKVSEKTWDRVLAVNLKGAFLCSQVVARKMVENKISGKIINVSSVNGFQVEPGRAHYNVSKGGLDMLTASMAVELGPYNINVNGIAPGVITGTDIVPEGFMEDPQFNEAVLSKTPLGRLGTVEDCVGTAVFLASDDSKYIQGHTIVIDGGLSIQQYRRIE